MILKNPHSSYSHSQGGDSHTQGGDLVARYIIFGIRPCATCESHIMNLCLGINEFQGLPADITISFSCMFVHGVNFCGEFRIIRRNSAIPEISLEDLCDVLERNFRTFVIIMPVPINDNDDSDEE